MTAPAWFTAAIATPHRTAEVAVAGATIRYLDAGPADAPVLVFVHGGTAHAHWWWPLAARLADRYRLLLPNLSGHGTSDHRADYSFDGWAEEVTAVLRAAAPGRPAIVIGHSIGGLAGMALAAEHPDLVTALIACDTQLAVNPDAPATRPSGSPKPVQSFASVAEARSRFRTIPAQTECAGYVLDHIVPESLRPEADRWVWSFDRGILARFDQTVARLAWPWLRRLQCPLGYLRSEFGLTPPPIAARLEDEVSGPVIVEEVPGAGHHAMLDRPEELFAALDTVLGKLPGPNAPRSDGSGRSRSATAQGEY
ncbi:alpha/beta fold hydrolase [Nocardia sp. alder85J]|uniref:alpha/beta fold hydrolase n=1 Tax=Nocardia sp. alder85J TaxID=2862949 RepID=UPI001CD51E96|nr:alpha/beta hydrolase [Nocardia sp. alder85J]MCX4091419.1 alpha/beta hydrolase [Nocardia sp. alder85J]